MCVQLWIQDHLNGPALSPPSYMILDHFLSSLNLSVFILENVASEPAGLKEPTKSIAPWVQPHCLVPPMVWNLLAGRVKDMGKG